VEHHCDAIDLNLGCPQRVAAQGHYGSFLLDDVDRPLVLAMVRAVSAGVSIPLFVKIRLLSTLEETVELVEQLRDAGAALVAIHARHRVDLTKRSGPSARDGPALLDQVTRIIGEPPSI
jgi:tRNA-dihydrouridine synthase 1